MCGITGIWNLNGKPIKKQVAEKFNNAIAHRGPDDQGIYIDNSSDLSLGHRRLSIIDLSSAGHQPMFSRNRNLVITYNGEIYNYLELKIELKNKGYVFNSNTDTEVILAAYEEWGEACLSKFNGMWAFAIWDLSKKSLFLSRDRFGIKPLYYVYQQNNLFAFASETIAFKSLDGFNKEIDRTNINLGIRDPFFLETINATIYKQILKLPAGHFIKIRDRRFEITKWWDTENNLIDVPSSYDDQVAYFKYLFTDSCKLRLRSDVPVGIALSGGLDSSSVYSTIQHLKGENLKKGNTNIEEHTAFVASFPGTNLDEKEFADEVVKYHNGYSKHIYPEIKNLSELILNETKLEDFIYLSPPVVHSIYAEMRKNEIKVSLDGHGADEMLYGYPNMIEELIRQDSGEFHTDDLISTWADMENVSEQKAQKLFNLNPAESKSFIHRAYTRYIPSTLKRIYRRQVFKKNQKSSWLLEYNEFPAHWDAMSLDASNASFVIPYKKFHGGMMRTILRNWDRASMRHGVEIRMPFMDWRLVSLIFSLPGKAKIHNGYSKNIVRDAMKGIMPESIRLRKNKVSINAPTTEWFNNELSSFILDIVHSQSFIQSDIWNGKLLRDYAEKKTKERSWTKGECNSFWPYLNAWILTH